MIVNWKRWHTDCVAALARGDDAGARGIVEAAVANHAEDGFDTDCIVDHVVRLRVARYQDVLWRQETQAFADKSPATLIDVDFTRECLLAIRFLLGLLALADPEAARQSFIHCLELSPNFLFALVEIAIIDRAVDRKAIFEGVEWIPRRLDWKYKYVAAEIGLAIGRGSSQDVAICVRGQADEKTAGIVRLHRALNPNSKVFVATWDTTPNQILDDLSATGAKVLLESDPAYPGESNKNRQLKLAHRLIDAASASGARFAILGRTDFAFFRNDLTPHLLTLLEKFPVAPGPLTNRLVIPDVYTRKFHLWHPSDLIMFGRVEDLSAYWDVAFTTRDNPGPFPLEIYLATEFCVRHKLYFEYSGFEGTRRLLREFFVVRGLDWFEACWLKKPDMRNGEDQFFINACLTEREWENLYYANDFPRLHPLANVEGGLALEGILGLPRF